MLVITFGRHDHACATDAVSRLAVLPGDYAGTAALLCVAVDQ